MMTLEAATFSQLDPQATEDQIAALEHDLGVRFPDELRRALPRCHSGSPSPQMVISVDYPGVGKTETTVARFLSVAPDSSYFVGRKLQSLLHQGLAPSGVVPFAIEGGGEVFALDYRNPDVPPAVVYLALGAAVDESDADHLVPIAPTFAAFLDVLVPA